MNDDDVRHHDPLCDPLSPTHWETCAQTMNLTIEGQRLIAQEIGCEMKLLWRAVAGWSRGTARLLQRDTRRGTG